MSLEMEDCLEMYKKMIPNSLKLSYKGVVTFEIIDAVLSIISGRLDIIEKDITTRKKVYGILMESLQNLCNHTETPVNNFSYDVTSILLTIENDSEKYFIKTGNFIPIAKVSELKKWIDKINSSSSSELRNLYNNILTNNKYSSKGGGGLGFLDIARKCSGKLKYNFEPVDDYNSFFTLNIQIKR